jgi:ribosomal protein L2
MNPVDHPHGGGEGKTAKVAIRSPVGHADQGLSHPQQQAHDDMIVQRRHKR